MPNLGRWQPMDRYLVIVSYGFLVLFPLVLFFRFLSGRKLRLPPSPRGLPLIGHLHLLRKAPHEALYSLSQRFGPIMSIRMGMVPAVVISNSALVKEMVKNNDLVFASRPYFLFGEYVGYNFKNMAHAPYGEEWKRMRKVCAVELFTSRRISSYSWVRQRELSQMVDTMLKAHNSNLAVNMRDVFATFTFNFMTQVLMTKRYFVADSGDSDVRREAREFKEISNELLALFQTFSVSESFPSSWRWLGKRIDATVPQFKRLHVKQDRFLQKIINEHKSTSGEREHKDFMDILLEEYRSEGPEGEQNVKALMMDMLIAGTDTSATTSEWALAELMHNPHTLERAQRELEQVVGSSRLVEESDYPNLEYLQAVIKETLRLHSPVTLILRMAAQACKLGGYDIREGTTLIMNVHAIARDLESWENPSAFMPERFIGSSLDVKGLDFELIPFGAGRRVCPGLPLGMKTIQLVLPNLIHGFNWSFQPGKEHSLEGVYQTVHLLKAPLEVVATPKLPLEAYRNF